MSKAKKRGGADMCTPPVRDGAEPGHPPTPGLTSIGSAAQDQEVLLHFFRSTGGESWRRSGGWASNEDIGTWFGVTTNDEGRVVELSLQGNYLRGTIPEALGNLRLLERLYLHRNQLNGTIPEALGNLPLLERLYLENNQLNGPIPPELGKLQAVVRIDLSGNNLIGTIPEALGNLPRLKWLYLHQNQLNGPIPPELGKLLAVKHIDLSHNNLTGSIPEALGNLPLLWGLGLNNNQITGPIPPELGKLQAVERIDLSGNNLIGTIPEALGNLPRLKWLYLHQNQLNGPIPPELGKLLAVEHIDLSYNNLIGTIPEALGNLPRLKWLYLHQNQLNGPIPPELGKLQAVERIDLSGNNLIGTIPEALGNLPRLKWLYLHQNQLNGPIPPELGKLLAVEHIDLSYNNLIGTIPEALGNLPRLKWLYLHQNQLNGTIPEALGNLPLLKWLFLHQNQLNGTIPEALGNLPLLERLYLHQNQLNGTIPEALGNLPLLERLDLHNNELTEPIPPEVGKLQAVQQMNLSRPVPENLQRHKWFWRFLIGLPMDGGPALPEIRDGTKRILLLPVVLGYVDLATDLYTAITYYRTGHLYWFSLVLLFAVVPTFIVVAFFLPHESWQSKLRVVTHTSLLYEALTSAKEQVYSPTLALLRVVEPLFESLPQTFLQLYALMLVWNETSSSLDALLTRLVSASFSVICLAYAAAGLCILDALEAYEEPVLVGDPEGCTQPITSFILKVTPGWMGGCSSFSSILRGCLGGCCTCIWHLYETCTRKVKTNVSRITPEFVGGLPRFVKSFFPSGRIEGQTMKLAVVGSVSKGHCFLLCFVYHIMEIASRFLSLALVALATKTWTFLLLAISFAVRYAIVRWVSTGTGPPSSVQPGDGSQGAEIPEPKMPLRLKMRIVATPFLDSIFEGKRDYTVALVVTLVEFVACLTASARLHRDSDELPSTERQTFAYAAVGFMMGKMILAWWLIFPLKRGASQATVEEPPVGTGSIEEAVISHAASEDQPAPTNGSEDAMERGNLGRVPPNRIGSAAIWGEKNEEASEGELRTDNLATLPVR